MNVFKIKMLPKDYIKNGKIKCLECGKYFVRPISHVWQKHNLLAREYKRLHNLDLKRGIATEEYRERMRAHVFENHTIDNLKKGKKYHFQKGQKGIGTYQRSEQTMERLKTHWEKVSNKKGTPCRVEKIKINCARCGKEKQIYPRALKEGKNFCSVVCRNITNNQNRTCI